MNIPRKRNTQKKEGKGRESHFNSLPPLNPKKSARKKEKTPFLPPNR